MIMPGAEHFVLIEEFVTIQPDDLSDSLHKNYKEYNVGACSRVQKEILWLLPFPLTVLPLISEAHHIWLYRLKEQK